MRILSCFLLGLALVACVPAQAQNCGRRLCHRPVQAAVVQQKAVVAEVVTPVAIATQFVPIQVAAYGASYQPGFEPELARLREEISRLTAQLGELTKAAGSITPAQAGPALMPRAEMPAPEGTLPEHVKLLTARCASCHGEQAAVKGGGRQFFTAGRLKALSCEEKVAILAAVKSNKMPRGGRPLSDEEFSTLLDLLDSK